MDISKLKRISSQDEIKKGTKLILVDISDWRYTNHRGELGSMHEVAKDKPKGEETVQVPWGRYTKEDEGYGMYCWRFALAPVRPSRYDNHFKNESSASPSASCS